MQTFTWISSALVIFLLLSGCSTPQTRFEEKPEVAKSLTKAQREAALQGKVIEGMSPDAVWLALGEPDRIAKGVEKDVKKETWIYSRSDTYEVPGWDYGYYSTSDGRIIAMPHYRPNYRQRAVDYFEVKFQNGKVIGWHGL
jgi:outer membrane protein assembly factor BamE (lipoprotein component of BamABCDE complex)